MHLGGLEWISTFFRRLEGIENEESATNLSHHTIEIKLNGLKNRPQGERQIGQRVNFYFDTNKCNKTIDLSNHQSAQQSHPNVIHGMCC